MDATYIHLVLTHFPIIGIIIGTGILAYGHYSNSNAVKKVALITIILMALLTIPVYLSGEEAEDTVENIVGVSESSIEDHEELAEVAIWIMGLLGLFALISFYTIIKELSIVKTTTTITLVIALITIGVFVQVGNLGGEIHHSEIRSDNSNNLEHQDNQSDKRHDDDDDDDDD